MYESCCHHYFHPFINHLFIHPSISLLSCLHTFISPSFLPYLLHILSSIFPSICPLIYALSIHVSIPSGPPFSCPSFYLCVLVCVCVQSSIHPPSLHFTQRSNHPPSFLTSIFNPSITAFSCPLQSDFSLVINLFIIDPSYSSIYPFIRPGSLVLHVVSAVHLSASRGPRNVLIPLFFSF